LVVINIILANKKFSFIKTKKIALIFKAISKDYK